MKVNLDKLYQDFDKLLFASSFEEADEKLKGIAAGTNLLEMVGALTITHVWRMKLKERENLLKRAHQVALEKKGEHYAKMLLVGFDEK